MKTKLIFILLALATLTANAQTLDNLINKYSNDKNCEYVSIQKGLFNLTQWLGGANIDKETKEVLSRIKTMKILTINLNQKADLRKNFQLELDKVIKRGNFEKMMVTRNKTDHSTVYGSIDANSGSELVIVAENDGQLSLIIMKGNLTHDDLEKIAK